MPECKGCGRFLTPRFVRVVYPDGVDEPARCPFCPDEGKAGFDGGRA